VFSAKPLCEPTPLRGFLCALSSGGPEGAGKLVLGSIRRQESIPAVRFLIALVIVDLLCRFLYAKTFVAFLWRLIYEE